MFTVLASGCILAMYGLVTNHLPSGIAGLGLMVLSLFLQKNFISGVMLGIAGVMVWATRSDNSDKESLALSFASWAMVWCSLTGIEFG